MSPCRMITSRLLLTAGSYQKCIKEKGGQVRNYCQRILGFPQRWVTERLYVFQTSFFFFFWLEPYFTAFRIGDSAKNPFHLNYKNKVCTARDTSSPLGSDNCVIDYLVKAYDKETGKNVSSIQHALRKRRRSWNLRNAHCRCSVVGIDRFENGNDVSKTLTRAKFKELNLECLLSRCSRMLGLRRARSTRYGISSIKSAHSLILLVKIVLDLQEFPS